MVAFILLFVLTKNGSTAKIIAYWIELPLAEKTFKNIGDLFRFSKISYSINFFLWPIAKSSFLPKSYLTISVNKSLLPVDGLFSMSWHVGHVHKATLLGDPMPWYEAYCLVPISSQSSSPLPERGGGGVT